MSTCCVPGCARPLQARGLCHGHYEYRRRTGTNPQHQLHTDFSIEERFWSKVDFDWIHVDKTPDPDPGPNRCPHCNTPITPAAGACFHCGELLP